MSATDEWRKSPAKKNTRRWFWGESTIATKRGSRYLKVFEEMGYSINVLREGEG